MQRLVDRLNQMCDAEPFNTHWYLKSLRSGEAADRFGDVVVPSASTRKISIMMAALKAVNEGRFRLDQPVRMLAKYQDNDSGCFQHLTPGFTITLRDALVMMIIVSDNTCTGTVADMVGLDEINAFCREIGMRRSIHRYGLPPRGGPQNLDSVTVTTARDVGLLLEMILAGAKDQEAAARLGCTSELCRLALQILAWQKLNTRMPSLLPQGTVVMHKTGTGPGVYNDAGIVCRGTDPLFILCCYTTGVPGELAGGMPGFAAAANLIGRLARAAYDFLKE